MASSIYIPKRIKVGFKKRADTYDGKIAYVIYFDEKGVLRQEPSWQKWREHDIEPVEFDNVPSSGFALNKGIKRFNWGHFGSNNSYIRVYDPRGIEFEISIENLLGILTHTNCSKRCLEGEFVYGFSKAKVMLLPVSSDEYQAGLKASDLRAKDVSAKELKAGCSYTTKKGETTIYLGRFLWFEKSYSKSYKSTKKHIFYNGKNFEPQSNTAFLSSLDSEDPVSNYADLIDQFKQDKHSSKITGWETSPIKSDPFELVKSRSYNGKEELKRGRYCRLDGKKIVFYYAELVQESVRKEPVKPPYEYEWVNKGYRFYSSSEVDTETLNSIDTRDSSLSSMYGYGYSSNIKTLDAFEFKKQVDKCQEVTLVLESGKRIPIVDEYSLSF
jgi:hypothetical protein